MLATHSTISLSVSLSIICFVERTDIVTPETAEATSKPHCSYVQSDELWWIVKLMQSIFMFVCLSGRQKKYLHVFCCCFQWRRSRGYPKGYTCTKSRCKRVRQQNVFLQKSLAQCLTWYSGYLLVSIQGFLPDCLMQPEKFWLVPTTQIKISKDIDVRHPALVLVCAPPDFQTFHCP